MRILFKQAVSFQGRDYKRGEHEVSEEFLNDKYFHRLLSMGWVQQAEEPAVITAETQKKRNEELAAKLLAASAAAVVEAKKEVAPELKAPVVATLSKDDSNSEPKDEPVSAAKEIQSSSKNKKRKR